jgi:hypothetical protein
MAAKATLNQNRAKSEIISRITLGELRDEGPLAYDRDRIRFDRPLSAVPSQCPGTRYRSGTAIAREDAWEGDAAAYGDRLLADVKGNLPGLLELDEKVFGKAWCREPGTRINDQQSPSRDRSDRRLEASTAGAGPREAPCRLAGLGHLGRFTPTLNCGASTILPQLSVGCCITNHCQSSGHRCERTRSDLRQRNKYHR